MDTHCLTTDELPDLTIEKIGSSGVISPIVRSRDYFTNDHEKILIYSHSKDLKTCQSPDKEPPMFERAGPRQRIFFDGEKINCGIVTCGGLCPGLNDVIRTIVLSLVWQYGVRKVFGFRYGYAGLSSSAPKEPLILTPESVDEIQHKGGDILSLSRGQQDSDDIVSNLEKREISLLFVIGGDGTLRGASDIVKAIKKRDLKIGVIGVPKTIDNDICAVEQSFGFSTAVEASRSAICGAHEEAKGAWNGVGLVKLMGRDSGFIAAYATLANSDANFCFIPEVPLVLKGENGFLRLLEKRLDRKHHALIVVAEGAGQDLIREAGYQERDASGNIVHKDIGGFLKKEIIKYFKKKKKPLVLKYIDPSYMIRSIPANSQDSAFCLMLGQNAVHAGMSGRTNMVISYWNQYFVHIPISLAVLRKKKVDPNGHLWQTVLETTGQV
ncbi:ATP-dependent 6-phosphofructokinase [bacterium]|nr:ATP-dependent 6-phosphofructokinase [bacterium]